MHRDMEDQTTYYMLQFDWTAAHSCAYPIDIHIVICRPFNVIDDHALLLQVLIRFGGVG